MNQFFFATVLLLLSNLFQAFEESPKKNQIDIREAHSNLIKKNDSFVTAKRGKIFSQELEPFNLIIDSLEQTVHQLVKKYQGDSEEIDSQIIDSLLIETKFKHRRYRLLYPNNYNRFADTTIDIVCV